MIRLFNDFDGPQINAFKDFLPARSSPERQVESFANHLLGVLSAAQTDTNTWEIPLQDLISLLVVGGNLVGIAAPVRVNTALPTPLVCWAVTCILGGQQAAEEALPGFFQLTRILSDPEFRSRFPGIHSLPDRIPEAQKPNPLVSIHYELAATPAYPSLAAALQQGLVRVLPEYGWLVNEKDILPYQALRTGLVRVFTSFNEEEACLLMNLLQGNKLEAAENMAREVASRIKPLRGKKKQLAEKTIESYVWGFGKIFLDPGDIQRREGYQRSQYAKQAEPISNEDDDPPDDTSREEKKRFRKQEEKERQEDGTGSIFDNLVEENEPGDERLRIALDERAVMQHYISGLEWSTLNINEIARVLEIIFQIRRNEKDAPDLRALYATLIFTGRELEWLLDVRLGNIQKDQIDSQVPHPIYDPEKNAIFYTPHSFSDIARPPRYRVESCIPVKYVWCLPLGSLLGSLWQVIAKRTKPGERILKVEKERVSEVLKLLTRSLQKSIPMMPPVTIGRLRSASKHLLVKTGEFDPVLAAIISDRRTLANHATMYYTMTPVSFLQREYNCAMQKVWEKLHWLYPDLPEVKFQEEESLPWDYNIGSAYQPKRDMLLAGLQTLARAAQEDDNLHALHNARTLLFIYLLSFLCGLRISEAALLRRDQFDSVEILPGKRIRLLHLPETRGNRYTTAERTIPIPEVLYAVLDALLKRSEGSTHAFSFCDDRGQTLEADAGRIRQLLDEYGVLFPRFHAGRHQLRTFLVQHHMPYAAINAILGHTRTGEELYNPYLPGDIRSIWLTYLQMADGLAEELCVKELITWINE